jgi:hypothetical protein
VEPREKVNMAIRTAVWCFLFAVVGHADVFVMDTSSYIGQVGYWGRYSLLAAPFEFEYGQTITALPSTPILTGFTFYSYGSQGPVPLKLTGYVAKYDGPGSDGPIVFQSSEQIVYLSFETMKPVTFNTGSVQLVGGQQYVLYFRLATDSPDGQGILKIGPPGQKQYGPAVARTFCTDCTWHELASPPVELGFKATFESVPEPAGAILLLTMLPGIAVLARRHIFRPL